MGDHADPDWATPAWFEAAVRDFRAEHSFPSCCEECAGAAPAPPSRGSGDATASALVDEVLAAERATAAAQVRQALALAAWVAAYSAPRLAPADDDVPVAATCDVAAVAQVIEEVAAALHLTDHNATRRVQRAVWLVSALPQTLAAWAGGQIDARRAELIADAAAALSSAHAAEVDARLCGPGGTASGLTSGELVPEIAAAVADVDAAGVAERSRRKAAQRRTGCRSLPDGTAEFVATGPATAVRELHEAVGALGRTSRDAARRGQGHGDPYAEPGVDGPDGRGIDAHRFDALHAAVTGAARDGAGDGSAAPAATVQVALSTLLGADDRPGELTGHGPVPAWLARRVARRSRLRRFLTDPLTGQLVAVDGHTYPPRWLDDGGEDPGPDPEGGPGPDAGQDPGPPPPGPAPGGATCAPAPVEQCRVQQAGGGSYRIPAAVDRFVRTAWGRCAASGCRRPARSCDLDHTVRHPEGPTCPCNLVPLCRRHHLMKHGTPRDPGVGAAWRRRAGTGRRRWEVHRCAQGHLHWTSPLGLEHVVAPACWLYGGSPGPGATAVAPLVYPHDVDPRCAVGADAAPGDLVPRAPWGGLDPERPPF